MSVCLNDAGVNTVHCVASNLRVTIGKVLTDELSLEIYRTVKRLASRGGPYAGIFDLSKVEAYRRFPEIAAKLVTDPSIPGERLCAIVASVSFPKS
jgi:hypothetical protein